MADLTEEGGQEEDADNEADNEEKGQLANAAQHFSAGNGSACRRNSREHDHHNNAGNIFQNQDAKGKVRKAFFQ